MPRASRRATMILAKDELKPELQQAERQVCACRLLWISRIQERDSHLQPLLMNCEASAHRNSSALSSCISRSHAGALQPLSRSATTSRRNTTSAPEPLSTSKPRALRSASRPELVMMKTVLILVDATILLMRQAMSRRMGNPPVHSPVLLHLGAPSISSAPMHGEVFGNTVLKMSLVETMQYALSRRRLRTPVKSAERNADAMNGPRKDRSRARCKARPPTFWKRSRHRVSGGETGQRSTLIQRLSTGHTAGNALAAKNPDADPDPDLLTFSRSRSTIISERPSREECAIKMDQNVPAPFVSCVVRPDPLARRTLTESLDDILSTATCSDYISRASVQVPVC